MAKAKRKPRRSTAKAAEPPANASPAVEKVGGRETSKPVPAKAKKESPAGKTPARRPKPAASKTNYLDTTRQFLREVRTELRKVNWPSRKEAMGTTGVVLVLVGILAIYLGILDAGLTKALTTLMR